MGVPFSHRRDNTLLSVCGIKAKDVVSLSSRKKNTKKTGSWLRCSHAAVERFAGLRALSLSSATKNISKSDGYVYVYLCHARFNQNSNSIQAFLQRNTTLRYNLGGAMLWKKPELVHEDQIKCKQKKTV